MHILVISRSTGRSRRRVASLMDSYAVRTGESSWSTPITREALAELRAALRRVASRTACVGCYVNVGRSRLRLAWTVGRGGEFEPTGATPVSWTRRKHKPVVPVWVRRLALLAAAGGVSHDIGKASCGFQRKLNSAEPVSDAVRHEWLSMQVRRRLRAMDWRAAWDLGGREGTAMTTVPEFMRHGITSALDAVDFLIVSHHGLLGPKRSDQNRSRAALPDDSLHIREVKEALSRDTLLPQAKLDARTLAEMNATERRLTAMSETVFPAGWWASAVFARAALVFADHTVSGVERKDRKAALYANTVRSSGGKGRSVLNQSLDWHLTEVSRRAADVLPRMMRPDLQGLSLDTIEHILKPNPEPGGRFQWQDAATDALVQLRERQSDAPVLVLNLAGTGSGKTRMNAKAACALARGPVRFSVALNLRTLTLQTGDALKHQLHVAADELAVVIGDAVVTQLHESRQRSSASKLDDDENPLVDDHDTTPGDFDLPPWLDAWVTQHPSQARLLGAPLLVSTIDYLIAAGEPHRQQHHVSALLRLLSSDLVLDEIDSYDPKAMVAVLRLIHMAGLCGRNVIASSATLAEPVAQAVCRVYVAGVQGRADMKGRAGAAPVQVVFLSDAQAPQCFDTADHTRSFEAAYRGYVEQGLLSLDAPARPRMRWATVVEATHPTWWGKDQYARVSADERGEGWMRYVVKAAKRLHRAHAWAFPGSTSKVSFGLIRVANIRPAISLARFIAAAGDGTDSTIRVQVACYHSQELLIQRHLKEARLDHLLSRSAGDEHLHRDPDLIERVRRADGRDVMFIVVATPVEEIGRDHDFDWAVIEPSSSQSIVQTAGRVNRHRLAPVTKPNIAVLDLNYLAAVRADRMDGAEPVFVRPGLEGDFPRALGEKAYPKHRLSALLANEFTVDARLRFRTEQYELSRLDDASLTAALTMPLEMITSTAIRPDPKLMAQVFYDAYPLREPSFKVELTVDPELDPDRQLKRWEKTAAGWRPLVTEYGEGHGTQARHPLDWLAWNLDELIEAAQALDLSADQCLCVEVNMPRRGDDVESADALKQLRWDRSFGFWMAPELLHSAAGASP